MVYLLSHSEENECSSRGSKGGLQDSSQLLAGLHQSINTADVARPPSHGAKEAGRLTGDLRVQHTVHDTRDRIPNTDRVDSLVGDTGEQRDKNCIT